MTDSEKLWGEYQATKFWVVAQGHQFYITVDRQSPDIDRLLALHQLDAWAYITAHNPKSQLLKPEDNTLRNRRLLSKIRGSGHPVFEGRGIGSDPDWLPEDSYLILGIPRTDAILLGAEFGQNAILVGRSVQVAELVSCPVDLPE
jgi:hypothetical protein